MAPFFLCFLHKWSDLNEIVQPSSYPLFQCSPRKWYTLKFVEPSSGPIFPCFPHKWYALKLLNPQEAHFIYVFLTNVTPYNFRTLKWNTLSMFPMQMVCLNIVEPSSGPLLSMFNSEVVRLKIVDSIKWNTLVPCFPCKWYALKLSNPQVAQFFHVSLTNGTP